MHSPSDIPTPKPMPSRWRGFTLVELMVAVAVVAILASIALPSYSSITKKQKVRAAQADLVALVLVMENFYALSSPNAYPAVTTSTAATQANFNGAWSPAQSDNFKYVISEKTATSYTLQAIGTSTNFSGCTISITSTNVRSLSSACGGGSSWY